jgi:hypothetical protein
MIDLHVSRKELTTSYDYVRILFALKLKLAKRKVDEIEEKRAAAEEAKQAHIKNKEKSNGSRKKNVVTPQTFVKT